MAGGLGKRMNSKIPKVLHQILNKPMLVRVIEQARLLLPYKILIIVEKYKDIIIKTLEKHIIIDENIIFINQPEALGTGHAIQCCIPELIKYKNSTTIILSGDVPLLRADTLRDFLQYFNIVKLITTLLDDPNGYGRIIEDKNIFNKIVEEKDCNLEEKNIKKVNCGIYAFNSEILCKYLPFLTNNNSQKEYYLTDIIEIIKKNENITVDLFTISKEKQYQVIGVNTIEQLYQLELMII